MASALETCALESPLVARTAGQNHIRVLAVIPESSANASMVFVKRQLASLNEAGTLCQAFLLASRTSPWVLVKEWKRLRAMIRTFQPDIVHAEFGTVTAFFTIMSTTLPVVITYRGSDLNPNPSDHRLRQSLGRLLSQLAALRAIWIICVSGQLVARLWWRRSRVSVIPSGVDTKVFFPRPRETAREQLGWGRNERVVLFNAGVDPVAKRFDLAQSALDTAKKLCGDIRFVVLDGNVAPDMIPLMLNAADCLLLTSDWEGSPNVVKEAIACNLPVVTVKVGDVEERLNGIEPTRIVVRDPEKIGSAVSEILQTGKRSNGWQRSAEELSVQRIAQSILSVYRSVVSRTNGRNLG